MKTREEVAKFITKQGAEETTATKGINTGKATWHYGTLELRELMDFIYEGEPTNEKEFVSLQAEKTS